MATALTLLLPSLIWPNPDERAAASQSLALPALSWLLGRGRCVPFTTETASVLTHGFALPQPAPFALLSAKYDGLMPQQGHWLRADPVHLQIEGDGLLLADHRVLDITQTEADALIATLNTHFEAEGLVFYAPAPERWYVQSAAPVVAEFAALSAVVQHNIDDFLPQGEDATLWRQRLNEIQMLLFSHPVNDAREASGLPTLNSLWWWGGAEKTAKPVAPAETIWADDALVMALACAAGVPADALPEAATPAWLAEQSKTAWVWLDALDSPATYHDGWVWQQRLAQLETQWFAPLRQALTQGQLQSIDLIVPGKTGMHCHISRTHCWRFWRQPRALSSLSFC